MIRHRNRRRASGGFTILEVVLAMGILVVGMTVIISLLTYGAALSNTAALRSSASTAIDTVLADLEETLFEIDAAGEIQEPEPIVDREVRGAPGVVYSASAYPNPENPIEYRVDVEMKWKSSGVQRTRNFTTILLKEIPFGERMRRQFVERSLPKQRTAPKSGE